jgi:hypothetical protein
MSEAIVELLEEILCQLSVSSVSLKLDARQEDLERLAHLATRLQAMRPLLTSMHQEMAIIQVHLM